MIDLRIGLGVVILATLVGGQESAPTPVQKLIREYSRGADVSTPERARSAALAFERAMSAANPKDLWWTKAQYDLGYDLAAVGEWSRAVRAFEKVVAAKEDARFPGMRATAADQAAQALRATKAPLERKIAAYRRALETVTNRDPAAQILRMNQRGSIVSLLTEEPGDPPFARAFAEWKVYVSEGRQGLFTPSSALDSKAGLSSETWRENALVLLRNIADLAAERQDVSSAQRAFDLYRRERLGTPMDIAFAASVSKAKYGPNVSAGEYGRLLNAYPQECAARSTVLADALEEAFLRDDTAAMRRYAEQILKMEAKPDEIDDPALQFAFARQVLERCRDRLPSPLPSP